MDAHPLPTLTLLASLAKAQRLGDADEGWIRRMTTAILTRLKCLDFNQLDVSIPHIGTMLFNSLRLQELRSILALSPVLPSIGPGIVQIAIHALDSSQAGEIHGEGYRTPESLPQQVFGACAKALADLPSLDWSEQVEISTWISRALKHWPNCQSIVSSLVAVLSR